MTNTIFYNLDNASYSTSSPDSTSSHSQHQQQGQEPEESGANVEASPCYSTTTVIAAAANAIKAWVSRVKLEEVNRGGNDQDLLSNTVLQSSMLKNFRFKELEKATRNFHTDSILGEGGFGKVFKGWIDENTLSANKPGTGTPVAVKRLKPEGFKNWIVENTLSAIKPGTGTVVAVKRLKPEGLQGNKEWLVQGLLERIKKLAQLYHPNLLRVVGYCLENERLLVYEFMPRGSLEVHLFNKDPGFQPLSWHLRMRIALEAAKGLAFLHNAETEVIHGKFNPSNILLDSNYNARLSDFGLAKDSPDPCLLVNTFGGGSDFGNEYSAPDFVYTGRLTAKSDVYSFGVVLLEILYGRRVVDKNRPLESYDDVFKYKYPVIDALRRHSTMDALERRQLEETLSLDAYHRHSIIDVLERPSITDALERQLEDQYSKKGALKAAKLTFQCLSVMATHRPTMNEVVTALEMICSTEH